MVHYTSHLPSRAGFEARVGLIENDLESEIARDRPATGEIHGSDLADRLNVAGELTVGNGVQLHHHGHVQCETPAFRFIHARGDAKSRSIRQLGNGGARPGAISSPIRGHIGPGPMLQDSNRAGRGRFQAHFRQPPFGLLDVVVGFVLRLFGALDCGLV